MASARGLWQHLPFATRPTQLCPSRLVACSTKSAPPCPAPPRPDPCPHAETKRLLYALFGQFGKIIDIVHVRSERLRGQVGAGCGEAYGGWSICGSLIAVPGRGECTCAVGAAAGARIVRPAGAHVWLMPLTSWRSSCKCEGLSPPFRSSQVLDVVLSMPTRSAPSSAPTCPAPPRPLLPAKSVRPLRRPAPAGLGGVCRRDKRHQRAARDAGLPLLRQAAGGRESCVPILSGSTSNSPS